MCKRLFGEYLARVVELTGHDVSEILEDQATSGRRFGDIAMSWGLCQPEHVWEAWAGQLAHHRPAVDLNGLGIDGQAAADMPARLARRMRAVPVRKVGEALVVATEAAALPRTSARLPRLLRRKMWFVVAPRDQIDEALATYYPAAATPAGGTVVNAVIP